MLDLLIRGLAALILVTALSVGAGSPALARSGSEDFESGGYWVAIERFDPPGGSAGPGVLLLHGSDGTRPGDRYHAIARALSAAGYRTFLLHYLDRTGQSSAPRSTIARNQGAWLAAASDALAFIARQPGIDPGRIGVVGISLGGGLGLALAADDPRIRAVVSISGWVPPQVLAGGSMPPILALHGAEDRIIPARDARGLDALLDRRGISHQVIVYPGAGHDLGGEAGAAALQETMKFLAERLRAR